MNKEQRTKTGFTLVEMLVVVAIVAILASMVIGIASRLENREKEKHCRSTLALLTTAIAQFHEYGFNYKGNFTGFNFPLDFNGFDRGPIEGTLKNELGARFVQISGDAPDPNYSSNEVMYLLLNMVPASRQTLEKIDGKLVTNLGLGGKPMQITITGYSEPGIGKVYPLFRVLDPWGVALRYDYYDEVPPPVIPDPKTKKNFPIVTSAGPDKKFGTSDDITNR